MQECLRLIPVIPAQGNTQKTVSLSGKSLSRRRMWSLCMNGGPPPPPADSHWIHKKPLTWSSVLNHWLSKRADLCHLWQISFNRQGNNDDENRESSTRSTTCCQRASARTRAHTELCCNTHAGWMEHQELDVIAQELCAPGRRPVNTFSTAERAHARTQTHTHEKSRRSLRTSIDLRQVIMWWPRQ